MAIFGASRPGFEFIDLAMPVVAPLMPTPSGTRQRVWVAYATQQMFFSFPEGPPSPAQLRVE